MSLTKGRDALHGALARSSPFTNTPRHCVVCSRLITSSCEPETICMRCWSLGWRPPAFFTIERTA